MAEGARLESVYTFTRIEGSNPSLTARIQKRPNRFDLGLFYWLNILLFQLSSTAQLSNEPIRFWIFFYNSYKHDIGSRRATSKICMYCFYLYGK